MLTVMEVDGMKVISKPSYICTNNDIIASSDISVLYKGASVIIPLGNKPLEAMLDSLYVIVLCEKGHTNHYRLVDVENNKLVYQSNETPWYGLKEALEWLSKFKDTKKYAQMYDFIRVMPYCPTTLDWIKSYMPLKRTRIDEATRRAVYEKCDGHCAYCGKEISYEEMQVDHVDSHYRHQGKDEIDNYLPSCRDCNGLKSDYSLEEFRNVLIPKCGKRRRFCGDNRSLRIAKAYKLHGEKNPKITFYFEKETKK